MIVENATNNHALPSFSTAVRAVLLVVGVLPSLAVAQSEGPPPTIHSARAGDCRIDVEIPARQLGSLLEVELNKAGIMRESFGPEARTIVLPLGVPLDADDELRARLDGGVWSETLALASATGPTNCGPTAVRATSTRPVFEAMGFLGTAFDQFAPNEVGNYIDEPSQKAKSRFTAGATFDYRLFGGEHSRVQLWVPGAVLWGLRTADVNCKEDPEVAVCSSTSTIEDRFLFVIDHASTIEAHFAPRLEFVTFQGNTDTPLRGYVTGQFGFIQLEGAPKVSETDEVGVGMIMPIGSFRRSFVQLGWGRTTLFRSNPRWNRFKVKAALVFDFFPALRERLEFWKFGGLGAMRGFIAISIDRNPTGSGPDAVQSYVGVAFDFRRAFVSQNGTTGSDSQHRGLRCELETLKRRATCERSRS